MKLQENEAIQKTFPCSHFANIYSKNLKAKK